MMMYVLSFLLLNFLGSLAYSLPAGSRSLLLHMDKRPGYRKPLDLHWWRRCQSQDIRHCEREALQGKYAHPAELIDN